MMSTPSVRSVSPISETDTVEFDAIAVVIDDTVVIDDETLSSDDTIRSVLGLRDLDSVLEQLDSQRAKSTPRHQVSHDLKRPISDTVIREDIEIELRKTGYPMHKVRCRSSDSMILLEGHVNRYYYLQVAIQIALRHAAGRQVVNRLEVITAP